MTSPQRFVIRMAVIVFALTIMSVFLYSPLRGAFESNIFLNGVILGVLFFGIIYNFRQVLILFPEVAWIENFRKPHPSLSSLSKPRLLSPMAKMLGEKQGSISLSTQSMRSLLDGIASRLDESRELSRYIIGLLIFLGLLGTFWGLLQTVGSIRFVISGLSVGTGDLLEIITNLKSGLTAPLDGMGTAFSSSLFGLAGSLVLGFLDLQAGQAQNRFYNDLEEWLSGVTRLSSGPLDSQGEPSIPAYVQAMLEQTAENLENLQRTVTRAEQSNIASNSSLVQLVEKLSTLNDRMSNQQSLLLGLSENQSDLRAILLKLNEHGQQSQVTLDEASQSHIRNLDVHVSGLLEAATNGREDMIQQLRSEIKLLARTIAASSQSPE
ncbi:MAG: flagellar motor protein MotA [Pseudomonadota bacterium]|nr:flagellar motor protein MotA [Pseudomonadota bacterium]